MDLHVYVKEKPTIREIKYIGLNAVSQSDVLDKFKELKVGLSQESQFDPTRVKRAEVVLKELLAAHGHQFATITTEIRQIPPAAVGITFNVKEGPKVKVGTIRFEGNKKVSSKYLRSAMKNLKPIGIPHSLILENLFARTYDATKLSEDAERVRFAFQDQGILQGHCGRPEDEDARRERDCLVFSVRAPARQGGGHHGPGGRGRPLPAEGDHLHGEQGADQHGRAAPPVQDQGRRLVQPHAMSARDWMSCARPTARWATSTRPTFRTR